MSIALTFKRSADSYVGTMDHPSFGTIPYEFVRGEPDNWALAEVWVDENGEPPDETPVVIQPYKVTEITFAQLRMALNRVPSKKPDAEEGRVAKKDLTDLVAACQAGVAPGLTALEQADIVDLVEYGNVVLRESAMVDSFAQMFGWTEEEVDSVFALAASLGG